MKPQSGSEVGPDRGWSWVVALAACFTSLVLAGIFRTGGVLFVAFIDAFGVTREEASWPMVICISVLNLTGPFSGMLGQRYGVRPVVMIGAIVGTVGVSACFFTTSLDVITVLFGGVFGVGYGLVNTLMPVIVNAYFLDLRGLANGIANSGSCFGSVILPLLFEYLIAHYGLSGCFLLTGGIVLNVAIAGALLRPPPWLKKKGEKRTNYTSLNVSDIVESSRNSNIPNNSEWKVFRRNNSNKAEYSNTKSKVFMDSSAECTNSNSQSHPHHSLQVELVEALKNRTKAQENISSAFADYKDPSSDSLFSTSSSLCVNNKSEQNELQVELFRAQQEFQDSLNDFQSAVRSILETSQSEEVLNKFDETDDVKTSELTDSCPARHSFSMSSTRRSKSKFNKSSVLNTRPLKKSNLKFENSSGELLPFPKPHCKSASPPCDYAHEHKRMSIPFMDDIEEEEKQIELDDPPVEKDSRSVLRSFQSVLSSPMFYVTALTNVSFYFLFHMYVVIVVDYSLDLGVADKDTKYIIFAFSAADLFGRLCLGWITDRKYVTRSRFVMICMAAIGIVFFTFPFATSFWTLIMASCGYGVLLGCTMIVFPILLVDYLGTEVHAVAYGCLCFLNGFASFTRPLIIGYFRDSIGSYANMFYILGIISVVAASAWLLEKYFIQKNREQSDILDDVNLSYTKQNNDVEKA